MIDERMIEAPSAPSPQAASATLQPAPLRSGRIVPISFATLIVALGCAALYWFLTRASAVRYVTDTITIGPVSRSVIASGTINPVITVQVGSYVSGVIQARFCDYNTQVKKGQLCAKIDPRPYQVVVDQDRANLAVARAQLVKDKANLTYTKVNLGRNQRLAATVAVSKDALDLSKSAFEQAQALIALDEATVALREADLRGAEINLGYTDIVSPVDGTVVTRSVEMGQTVAASFQTPTLFLVATDLNIMQVDTNISESDIGAIKVGNAASFTVESFPNHPFEGRVTQVRQSPQTIQNVVTYDATIDAPNPERLLKPGMTATARIVVNERANVLRAPNLAFRYIPANEAVSYGSSGTARVHSDGSSDGSARLWILRDGVPLSIVVTPGLDDDSYTEIVKGDLKSGDAIIVAEETQSSSENKSAPIPAHQ
jgi:HlyD family secretion protein